MTLVVAVAGEIPPLRTFLDSPGRSFGLCISSVRESANATGDSVWWGVWLGRHICQRATQVSQGRLRQDGNPPSNRRAKAGSIGASSAGDDRESAAHRSFREFSSSGVWSERCQNSYLRGNWLVAAKRS